VARLTARRDWPPQLSAARPTSRVALTRITGEYPGLDSASQPGGEGAFYRRLDEQVVAPRAVPRGGDMMAVGAKVLALTPPRFEVVHGLPPLRKKERRAAEWKCRRQRPQSPPPHARLRKSHAFISPDDRRVKVTRGLRISRRWFEQSGCRARDLRTTACLRMAGADAWSGVIRLARCGRRVSSRRRSSRSDRNSLSPHARRRPADGTAPPP